MRKIIFFIATILAICNLSACASKIVQNKEPEPAKETVAEASGNENFDIAAINDYFTKDNEFLKKTMNDQLVAYVFDGFLFDDQTPKLEEAYKKIFSLVKLELVSSKKDSDGQLVTIKYPEISALKEMYEKWMVVEKEEAEKLDNEEFIANYNSYTQEDLDKIFYKVGERYLEITADLSKNAKQGETKTMDIKIGADGKIADEQLHQLILNIFFNGEEIKIEVPTYTEFITDGEGTK